MFIVNGISGDAFDINILIRIEAYQAKHSHIVPKSIWTRQHAYGCVAMRMKINRPTKQEFLNKAKDWWKIVFNTVSCDTWFDAGSR